MRIKINSVLLIVFLAGFLALAGCKTVDMAPKADTARMEAIPETPLPVVEETKAVQEPEVIFIERPVYIPEKDASPKAPGKTGVDSVRGSNMEGTISPSAYSHAARVYDYHSDQVFEVYTQILRTTDLCLEPGELVLEVPVLSDSERWIVGAGVSRLNGQAIQHIYIKPKEAGLEASMIINTDKRVYHILLRSYATVYMPIVRWNYSMSFLPFHFTTPDKGNGNGAESAGDSENVQYVDPRFLSFDYTVKYPPFRRYAWLPRMVYDDGKKTYVVFNEQVLQQELPGVFENKNDVLNYRVIGEMVVIDKLIEQVTIKYKKGVITITKKKGRKNG
jgi:type IV secretion system protein VirB9